MSENVYEPPLPEPPQEVDPLDYAIRSARESRVRGWLSAGAVGLTIFWVFVYEHWNAYVYEFPYAGSYYKAAALVGVGFGVGCSIVAAILPRRNLRRCLAAYIGGASLMLPGAIIRLPHDENDLREMEEAYWHRQGTSPRRDLK